MTQLDTNSNGIGNSCDNGQIVVSDTDGDGVPDSVDLAPTIPEDPDGYEDSDGIPEIQSPNPTLTSSVVPTQCMQCPCHYTDFASSLAVGDEVRAVLLYSGTTTSVSSTVIVR